MTDIKMKRSGQIKRTKQMRRTGFKRKPPVQKSDLSKLGIRELAKKAWPLMSRYIRLRDLGKTCITCSKVFSDIKDSQAGHLFHAAKTNPVSYDERNIHAQCMSCNCFDSGRHAIYAERVIAMYGCDALAELRRIKNMTLKGKDKKQFFIDKIHELEEKLAAIETP